MRFTLATSIVALVVLTAATPQRVGQNIGMAIPIAKRSGLTKADKSVDIEALKSHTASTKAKVLRGLHNFQRNTGTLHPAASKGTHRRATGADPLTNDKEQLWYGNVSVGTPNNIFTVDFDTGSSDLFLPGPNCTSNCVNHAIYNPYDSSTSGNLHQDFKLSLGDGSAVSGVLFSDTVSVSGLSASNQTIGVATTYSSSFAVDQFPADGMMGMAFQSISAYNATPVFQTMVSQGQTDAAVFSFKLATSGSELYLGGANSALYTGDFAYTPVTEQGFWQVRMDGVVGNGQPILSNIDSIIDTGTSLVVGTPSDVKTFYDALGGTDVSSTAGSGHYSFPCNSFPAVTFTFGGTSFPISADTLNLGPVSSGSSDCLSGIIGQDTGSSYWIIGDVFLRNVYTTFDMGKSPRVGFAKLA